MIHVEYFISNLLLKYPSQFYSKILLTALIPKYAVYTVQARVTIANIASLQQNCRINILVADDTIALLSLASCVYIRQAG